MEQVLLMCLFCRSALLERASLRADWCFVSISPHAHNGERGCSHHHLRLRPSRASALSLLSLQLAARTGGPLRERDRSTAVCVELLHQCWGVWELERPRGNVGSIRDGGGLFTCGTNVCTKDLWTHSSFWVRRSSRSFVPLKFFRDDLMPAAASPSVNSATVNSPSPSTSIPRRS